MMNEQTTTEDQIENPSKLERWQHWGNMARLLHSIRKEVTPELNRQRQIEKKMFQRDFIPA